MPCASSIFLYGDGIRNLQIFFSQLMNNKYCFQQNKQAGMTKLNTYAFNTNAFDTSIRFLKLESYNAANPLFLMMVTFSAFRFSALLLKL